MHRERAASRRARFTTVQYSGENVSDITKNAAKHGWHG
jgi:hypothetical protein